MDKKILFPDDNIIITKLFRIGQDWETPIPGFFIISPLRKIRSIEELTDEESIEFMYLIRKIRRGMKEVLGIKDVYLFQNDDNVWGTFHMWIFPRLPWMDTFGREIQSVIPIIDYARIKMKDDKVFKEVKNYVKKMKKYMGNS